MGFLTEAAVRQRKEDEFDSAHFDLSEVPQGVVSPDPLS